jgi:hypothetical protein
VRPTPSIRLGALLAGLAALATLPATAVSAPKPLTYRITVTNLTSSDLTRIAVVAHDRRATIWRTGGRASRGLSDLAEDGSTTRLLAEARGRRGVRRAFAAGRIAPGRSTTFTVRTTTAQRRLTLATMLVCTNDGFTGVASRPLPLRKGARAGRATWRVPAYDAGSERNTESSAHVPCLGAHHVGEATAGRVRMHPGISGRADLVPSRHDWGRYAARIVIRPA